MTQASLFGSACCVYIFTHPWEQEKNDTLLFPPEYLITLFHRWAKQHMYIYFDLITVCCESRSLQNPDKSVRKHTCNNYVACSSHWLAVYLKVSV